LTLLALCLAAVVVTGATLLHQGYRIYVVHTGSMMPTYNPGDVVLDRPASNPPKPGQVITFRHSLSTTDVVTHRVTDVTAAGLIHTKGDANRSADLWDIRPDMVRGTVARAIPRLGFVLVFLKQPAGIGALGCSALALLMLWSLFFATSEIEQARNHQRGRHSVSPASWRTADPSSDITPEPRYVSVRQLLT
jgi:signal peptidase